MENWLATMTKHNSSAPEADFCAELAKLDSTERTNTTDRLAELAVLTVPEEQKGWRG
ncbi:MAG: hypothetical protein II970_03010 [Paludibacteraceae bacterium]|nr:hypothetical protein [Paludibacteraceae bacterium]